MFLRYCENDQYHPRRFSVFRKYFSSVYGISDSHIKSFIYDILFPFSLPMDVAVLWIYIFKTTPLNIVSTLPAVKGASGGGLWLFTVHQGMGSTTTFTWAQRTTEQRTINKTFNICQEGPPFTNAGTGHFSRIIYSEKLSLRSQLNCVSISAYDIPKL